MNLALYLSRVRSSDLLGLQKAPDFRDCGLPLTHGMTILCNCSARAQVSKCAVAREFLLHEAYFGLAKHHPRKPRIMHKQSDGFAVNERLQLFSPLCFPRIRRIADESFSEVANGDF